jgi:tyrosyl-tRNA synthetase
MARYYLLLLGDELAADEHPLEAKKALAQKLVARYHDDAAAATVRADWDKRSSGHLDEVALPEFPAPGADDRHDLLGIVQAAFELIGEPKSGGDVRRLIQQGSIQVDGEKITDPKAEPPLNSGQVLKLNKKRSVRIA